MRRFRCPECGAETEVVPNDGGEIVSVYCLKHRGGADAHRRPVYMACISAETTAAVAEPEPVAA